MRLEGSDRIKPKRVSCQLIREHETDFPPKAMKVSGLFSHKFMRLPTQKSSIPRILRAGQPLTTAQCQCLVPGPRRVQSEAPSAPSLELMLGGWTFLPR